jgi:hypothetical protein
MTGWTPDTPDIAEVGKTPGGGYVARVGHAACGDSAWAYGATEREAITKLAGYNLKAGAAKAIRRLLEDERPDLTFEINFPADRAAGKVEAVGDNPDPITSGSASLPDDDTGKRAA